MNLRNYFSKFKNSKTFRNIKLFFMNHILKFLIDFRELFLDSNQELVAVKFFTSRLTHDEAKEERQSTYLAALSLTGVDLIYGSYHNKTIECYHCNHKWITPTEKMTPQIPITTSAIRLPNAAKRLCSGVLRSSLSSS